MNNRRDFIKKASLSTVGLAALGSNILAKGKSDKKIVTAGDLNKYLRSIVEVHEPSVDRIIYGDPNTKIKKVGTCWMPYLQTLKDAKKQGVNVMVVHEPTFYTHFDLDEKGFFQEQPSPGKEMLLKAVEDKKKWLDDNDMVIIRSHDVMDIVKEFGMPFAFGQALGFDNSDIIRSRNYYNVYKIEPQPAGVVAKKIAQKLKVLDQPGVGFYGDEERIVKSVGLGTGMIANPLKIHDLEPDLFITIDDTVKTWIEGTFSEDTGYPMVVVNHGTSETSGMKTLNEFLTKKIDDIDFIHFKQGCSHKWITG